MAERSIICLRCPRGCEITATLDNDGRIEKTCGNFCKLGIEYAAQEVAAGRPGSEAVLAKLSELLFVESVRK